LPDSAFALIQKVKNEQTGKTTKRRRFPIQDCAHARNALARLPNAKETSDDERAQVKRKADAKLASDECKSKLKGGVMADTQEQEKELAKLRTEVETTATALETSETENERLSTELAELKESSEAAAAKATEEAEGLTAKVDELQTQLEEIALKARLEKLSDFVASEKLEEQKEDIGQMSEPQFNLLVAAYEEGKQSTKPHGPVINQETEDGTVKVTL
jgi:hypothetical protein